MADIKVNIPKLNNSNYQVWKYKVELLLIKESLWNVVTEDRPTEPNDQWRTNDGKARATIGLLVEDNQLGHIRKCTSSKEMWDSLRNYHQKSTLSNKVSLLKRLCNLKLSEGDDMENHINKMSELIDQLSALGENLAEQLTVALLLSSLPESYSTLITALETRPEQDLNQELVKNKLIEEDIRRKEMKNVNYKDQEKAYKANFDASQKFLAKKRTCFFCKKPGHDKIDCRKYKAWLQKQNSYQKKNDKQDHKVNKVDQIDELQKEELEEHISFMAVYSESATDWYIDSGASSHMTNNLQFFSKIDKSVQENVYLANGECLITAGKGEGYLSCRDNQNKVRQILIKDVLYVPELHGSLLSVKRLVDKGFEVNFNNKECYIKLNNKIIAIGKMKNLLYILNVHKALHVKEDMFCIHEWHRMLGHRDLQAIKALESKRLATGIKIKYCTHNNECEICIKAKMTRDSFPNKSSSETAEILDLVHSDVCGPMHVPTPRGNRFVLTLIDDYSRYTHLYLLKNKSEVPEKVINFVKQMKTMFGKTLKCFRSDRGGEYINDTLEKFFKNEGISRQTSAPYTPEQNGIAERKNRYLIEMTRCLLIESELDEKFWGEAVVTANFLQNRLPTRKHGVTPYERWYSKIPNLEEIKTFGCEVYSFIPENQRHKLNEKAVKRVFVGYEEGSKAYRLLDPKTSKVIISKRVEFLTNQKQKLTQIPEDENQNYKQKENKTDLKTENCEVNVRRENKNEAVIKIFDEHENNKQITDSLKDEENAFDSESDEDEIPDRDSLRRSVRVTKGKAPDRLIETINMVKENKAEPTSYNEAIISDEAIHWKRAMKEEFQSLKKNETWDLVKLPPNKQAVTNKWVFKRKLDAKGNIDRYKARLVAHGYSQKYGEEYDEVFAPVVRQTTFRTLLTVAGKTKMKVKHYDIETAYLNGDLHHDIYMTQPEGFEEPGKEHFVCKLKKSLYGLKQSANEWNRKINQSLIEMGFKQSHTDPCLYSKKTRETWIYILIYVDDVIAASISSENLHDFEFQLKSYYKMKDLGEIKYYLGINIERDEDGIFYLHQESYIKRKLKELRIEDSKPSKIPMEPGFLKRNEVEEPLETNNIYRRAIGSLLYVSTNTRPDIAVSTSILASRSNSPTQSDWNEVKRVFRYLKTTLHKKLKLGSISQDEYEIFEGFVDANWGGGEGRRSNSGYLFRLYGGTITWSSKRQQSVALSSAEAEYVALAEAVQEAIWLDKLLKDLNIFIQKPIILNEDNQSCIKMLSGKFSQRTKHIDIKYHFVRELVEKNFIKVMYCPTELMQADILTKPLEGVKTAKFVDAMGLKPKH